MKPAFYPINSVDPHAEREHEQMGSKAKLWYRADDEKWFSFARFAPLSDSG